MGVSTGPVLAIGAISLANRIILNAQPWDETGVRIVVGTGIAAAGLALLERLSPALAMGLAWLGLVSVLLVRIDPAMPTPVESLYDWWRGPKAAGTARKRTFV